MKSIQATLTEQANIILETDKYFKLNTIWLNDRDDSDKLRRMIDQGNKVKYLIEQWRKN